MFKHVQSDFDQGKNKQMSHSLMDSRLNAAAYTVNGVHAVLNFILWKGNLPYSGMKIFVGKTEKWKKYLHHKL